MPVRIPTGRPTSLPRREGAGLKARLGITGPDLDLARAATTTGRECPLFGGRARGPAAPAGQGVGPRRVGRAEVPEFHHHGTVRGILLTLPQGALIRRPLRGLIV